MKKSLAIALLSSTFLLTSCGGNGEVPVADTLEQNFETFSINIPGNWRRVNQDNFANTIPKGTSVIFLSPSQGGEFLQNVNIVQESLNTDASSLEYGKANLILGSKAIIDYRPVSTEESNIQGIKTVFHTFRARNVSTDPLRSYAQSYFARDRVGYTVTCIAQDESIDQQQTCETIIKSFRFS